MKSLDNYRGCLLAVGVLVGLPLAAIAYVVYAFVAMGDYAPIQDIDLGDGYVAHISRDTIGDPVAAVYCHITHHNQEIRSRKYWTTDPPHSYELAAITSQGGRYAAIIEVSQPNAVLLLYDKYENKMFGQDTLLEPDEVKLILQNFEHGEKLYMLKFERDQSGHKLRVDYSYRP